MRCTKNPLEVLLRQNNLTVVAPGSESEKIILRVSSHIDNIANEPNGPVFSPIFKCLTTMSFYASILRELEDYVALIDDCPSWSREIVWEQLFTIVGSDKRKFSGFFTPVLQDTMKETKVNLMDIEVMFLAFFLIINIFPEIFVSRVCPDFISVNSESLRIMLRRNAQDLLSSIVRVTPQNNYRIENEGNRNVIHINDDPPVINLNDNITHQLRMLEIWSNSLNNLPSDKKIIIWDYCGKPTFLQDYITSNNGIDIIIHEWSLNPEGCKSAINLLYNCISYLHENGIIPRDIPNDRSRNNSPSFNNFSNPRSPISVDSVGYKRAFSAPAGKINNETFAHNNPNSLRDTPFILQANSSPSIITLPTEQRYPYNSIKSQFERMEINDDVTMEDVDSCEKNKVAIQNLLNDS